MALSQHFQHGDQLSAAVVKKPENPENTSDLFNILNIVINVKLSKWRSILLVEKNWQGKISVIVF